MIKKVITPPKLKEVRIFKKISYKKPEEEFSEEVVQVDRITRVVAGGKRLRFRATVIIGNKNGKVGLGVNKANDVVTAIQKAVRVAKKHLIDVPIQNNTIPHEIIEKYGAAKVLLKPAAEGTGIIAGGPVRIIANSAGIKNICGKILGSHNKINNLKAVIMALKKLSPRKGVKWKFMN